MNIKISKKANKNLNDDEINIIIEYKNFNPTCTDIEEYLTHYIENKITAKLLIANNIWFQKNYTKLKNWILII